MAHTVTDGPKAGGLTERVSLPSTTAVEVNLPSWVRKCTLVFKTSAGALADGAILRGKTQADGAAMGDHAFPVPAGVGWEVVVSPGQSRQLSGCTIYVSGPASGFAHLDMEL